MKNTIRLLGIVALAAIIGFTMTACKTDDEGDPGGPTLYPQLDFSNEQVYVDGYNANGDPEYKPFTGTITFTSPVGGSATISGGKLTVNITTPNSASLTQGLSGLSQLDGLFTDIRISDPSVKSAILSLRETTSPYRSLSRENEVYNETRTSMSGVYESLTYVYVDKPVTITGKGSTVTETENFDGVTVKWTETIRDLNISLAVGWNTVYYREDYSGSYNSESSGSANATLSVSISNPSSLKWVISDYSSSSYYSKKYR